MINQGSILQAYCVFKLLQERFPNSEIEIIDLIPKNRGNGEKKFFKKSIPFIRFDYLARFISMRKFLKNRVKFSPNCDSMDLGSQIAFINEQNYDIVFTGSDTVWMDSEKLNHILPHIYFLPKGIKTKKNAIAASLDPLKDESRFYHKRIELSENLSEFDNILVRDNITFQLINSIIPNKARQISDPTILYPFEENLNIRKNKEGVKGKIRIHISFGEKSVKEKIKELLISENTFEIIDFVEKSSVFSGDHIVDYLNEYTDIDILITDRFHRSIFALKLSSALIINVEHFKKNPLPKSKGRDLFSKLGCPEYCIRYEENGESDLKKSIKNLINNWDQDQFLNREHRLKQFISENQTFWQKVDF
jgi:hypothetical protein